jgi:plastocyanin
MERAAASGKEPGMVRRRAVVVAVAAILGCLVGAPSAHASGGGGCPPPITTRSTTRAVIKNWCFSPTVIRIKPGDTVTWLNRDPVAHTITGANRAWGNYRKIRTGRPMRFRFNESGVYPYYCVIHLGMVGVVVVGDGAVQRPPSGDASQRAVTRVRLTSLSTGSDVAAPATVPNAREPHPMTAIGIALSVMAAVGVAAGVVRRRSGSRLTP